MPRRQGGHHGSGAPSPRKANTEMAAALHRPLAAAGGQVPSCNFQGGDVLLPSWVLQPLQYATLS